MNKDQKTPIGLKIEYPSQEEARFFTNSLNFPISDIIIGITYPFPNYSVTRKATGKYYLFEYVLSGEGRVMLNGKWQTIKKDDVLFYIKENDVVITKLDGTYITTLKDGVSNERVKNARKRKI